MLPVIHSHDSWTQLEEVWLGDVYPASYYDHLAPEVRDVFYEITEITKQDLNAIQKTLQDLGVIVRRPQYQSINYHINPGNGYLFKPQIMPRDNHVTLGQTLYVSAVGFNTSPWQHVIDEYSKQPGCTVTVNHNDWFVGANTVRMGRDVIVDCYSRAHYWAETGNLNLKDFLNYRITVLNNGGHLDGCFAILKPGLLMTNCYYDKYDETFPNWHRIHLTEPSYYSKLPPDNRPMRNGKFWDTAGPTNKSFNQHVIDYALDWVGTYNETYFELNCLVVNEQTVVMLGESEKLAEELHSHGINVHWVPFRTRTFWDGGVHCLTLDIRRRGQFQDYFARLS